MPDGGASGAATFAGGTVSSSSRSESPCGWGAVRSHKVVFLGEMGTGKTSIIRQFMYRTFDQCYQATVGMDFVSKRICLEDGRAVRLQVWDTAGQERFRSLIPGYLRDSSACIVVYDITSRSSFAGVRGWAEQAWQDRAPTEVLVVLVGNKTDLEADRAVQAEEGEALAAELGTLFFEASARRAERVEAIFNGVALALPSDTTKLQEAEEEIVLEPPRGAENVRVRRSTKKCC
eukprot:TRINITY_DN4103_c0_g1_i2.p1 TRINITY_DN4103_c0_g1~~TRINITY_DN4103_c0_g1_i2.p1  ORF type:complete len:250 (+),score=43.23 TRINITY_DN4103_c0_g1_i2:52-750(+)